MSIHTYGESTIKKPTPLPAWAKICRNLLMVGNAFALVTIGMYARPLIFPNAEVTVELYVFTTFWNIALMVFASPYLGLAVSYAVIWFAAVRGKGYAKPNIFGSIYLAAVPTISLLAVGAMFAIPAYGRMTGTMGY